MIYCHVTGVITDVIEHDEQNVKIVLQSDDELVWCFTDVCNERLCVGTLVHVTGEMNMRDVSDDKDVDVSWLGRVPVIKLREFTVLASPFENVEVH